MPSRVWPAIGIETVEAEPVTAVWVDYFDREVRARRNHPMVISNGYGRDGAGSFPFFDKWEDVESGDGFVIHAWVTVDGHALA